MKDNSGEHIKDDTYAPAFVKEAEEEAKAQEGEVKEPAKKAEPKATKKKEPDKDMPVVLEETKELTPAEKSNKAMKAVFAKQIFNQIAEKTKAVLDKTSNMGDAEINRLLWVALNKAENALEDRGLTWANIRGEDFVAELESNVRLGMDAEQGDIYLIAQKKKKEDKKYLMSVERSYRGEMKLCKKYAANAETDPIEASDAFLIREGDTFSRTVTSSGEDFVFTPKPLNEGKVKGAFAYVKYVSGRVKINEMTPTDIKKRKDASFRRMNNKESPAWKYWEDEMILAKTFKTISKSIPKDFKEKSLAEAYAARYISTNQEIESPQDRIALKEGFEIKKADV